MPARVDAQTKAALLELIDHATDEGWPTSRACHVLGLRRVRVHRWLARRALGLLVDKVGGKALHGLLDWEVEAILALRQEWGETDRSHRKLGHRGSYLGLVWVSPSSVRRVLAAGGCELSPRRKRAGTSTRKPFPDWVDYRVNQLWIYDTERHEALLDRVEVKGLRLWPVAAGC